MNTPEINTPRPIRDFNRFEIKYIVPVEKAHELIRQCRDFLVPDPYAGSDGTYHISSLYYDTEDLKAYWEKIEGLKFRRKIRVRRYDDTPSDTWFVEIKQRIDRTVQKRRIDLHKNDVSELMNDGNWDRDRHGSHPVLGEVAYLKRTLQLQPTVVVTYRREPHMGVFDNSLRITVDTLLYGRRGCLEDWGDPAHGRLFLPLDMAVLEVKFDNYVPLWLCKILSGMEFQSERMSKYCSAVGLFWNQALVQAVPQPPMSSWRR